MTSVVRAQYARLKTLFKGKSDKDTKVFTEKYCYGDEVEFVHFAQDLRGVIKFIGVVYELADGSQDPRMDKLVRYGIECFDAVPGGNNGTPAASYAREYFKCADGHGVFVFRVSIKKVVTPALVRSKRIAASKLRCTPESKTMTVPKMAVTSHEASIGAAEIIPMGLSTVSLDTRSSKASTSVGSVSSSVSSKGGRSPLIRADTIDDGEEDDPMITERITVNDIVEIGKRGYGLVKFIGHIEGMKGWYFGVELLQERGKHDGFIKDNMYFLTREEDRKHGLHVKPRELSLALSIDKKIQLKVLQTCGQMEFDSTHGSVLGRNDSASLASVSMADGHTMSGVIAGGSVSRLISGTPSRTDVSPSKTSSTVSSTDTTSPEDYLSDGETTISAKDISRKAEEEMIKSTTEVSGAGTRGATLPGSSASSSTAAAIRTSGKDLLDPSEAMDVYGSTGSIIERVSTMDAVDSKIQAPVVRNFDDYFIMDPSKDLKGEGAYGAVFRCKHKKKKDKQGKRRKYAVKRVDKAMIRLNVSSSVAEIFKSLQTEIACLRKMRAARGRKLDGYLNVMQFEDAFEDPRYFYLVTNYCNGGTLYDYIQEQSRRVCDGGDESDEKVSAARPPADPSSSSSSATTAGSSSSSASASASSSSSSSGGSGSVSRLCEKSIQKIMRDVLSGLNYMSNFSMLHLDLNPNNIMRVKHPYNDGEEIWILIDFGMARVMPRCHITCGPSVGTAFFIAPEVLRGEYDPLSDVWSFGVILFFLLFGYPPFGLNPHDPEEKLFKEIKRGFLVGVRKKGHGNWVPIDYASKYNVSEEAVSLIDKCLTMDLSKRCTVKEALDHPFFTRDASDLELPLTVRDAFVSFTKQCEFRSLVAKIFSAELSFEERQQVRTVFKSLDRDGDAQISKDEFVSGMRKLEQMKHYSARDLERMFNEMDVDNNGVLDLQELETVFAYQKLVATDERLERVFDELDVDGNGCVTAEDLEDKLLSVTQHSSVGDSDIIMGSPARSSSKLTIRATAILDIPSMLGDPDLVIQEKLPMLTMASTIPDYDLELTVEQMLIRRAVKAADTNGDGKISKKEFMASLHPLFVAKPVSTAREHTLDSATATIFKANTMSWTRSVMVGFDDADGAAGLIGAINEDEEMEYEEDYDLELDLYGESDEDW